MTMTMSLACTDVDVRVLALADFIVIISGTVRVTGLLILTIVGMC